MTDRDHDVLHGMMANSLENGLLQDLEITMHEDGQVGSTLDAALCGPRPAARALE